MSNFPSCARCGSEYTYKDGGMMVCPECGTEWPEHDNESSMAETSPVLDANGNSLQNGDAVTIIKDLKVKGALPSSRSA